MLCALCVSAGLALAQSTVTLDDLKIRADGGDRSATRQLAEAYYLGREGAEQNFTEAARWYTKLAQQGDRRAQTTLGLMYIKGYGVKRDPAEAFRWWTLAAVGNDPAAQYNLGTLYFQGLGTGQDFAQAARWYRDAAMKGHVQAQHDLGLMYHDGKGLQPDPVRAYYWIRVAALQGDDKAEETLKKVAVGMNSDQIRDAERQANEWMAKAKKILK